MTKSGVCLGESARGKGKRHKVGRFVCMYVALYNNEASCVKMVVVVFSQLVGKDSAIFGSERM